MTSQSLRFGIHDFLNAQPLLVPLREREKEMGITLITASPAELADRLRQGGLDMAMIPAVEYLKDAPRFRLLPNIAIASRGPVGTVLFASKKPLEEVQSIALDARSRTSAALLQVLYGEVFPWNVFLETRDPEPKAMLEDHDAALVIGDPAFRLAAAYPNLHIYDLSEQWFEQTGKTFVHAVVAVREEIALDHAFVVAVQEAKLEGLSGLEDIAQVEGGRVGIGKQPCLEYLSQKIIYDLGKEELEGLQHFRDICHDKGVIDEKEMIRFVRV